MQVVSKYEVACPTCDVKYPVGQKRCVHCGGRTAPSVVDMADAPASLSEGMGQVVREREPEPLRFGDGEEMVFMPAGTGEADEEQPRGGGVRKFGGLLWVAIFAVITLIRACFEE